MKSQQVGSVFSKRSLGLTISVNVKSTSTGTQTLKPTRFHCQNDAPSGNFVRVLFASLITLQQRSAANGPDRSAIFAIGVVDYFGIALFGLWNISALLPFYSLIQIIVSISLRELCVYGSAASDTK